MMMMINDDDDAEDIYLIVNEMLKAV